MRPHTHRFDTFNKILIRHKRLSSIKPPAIRAICHIILHLYNWSLYLLLWSSRCRCTLALVGKLFAVVFVYDSDWQNICIHTYTIFITRTFARVSLLPLFSGRNSCFARMRVPIDYIWLHHLNQAPPPPLPPSIWGAPCTAERVSANAKSRRVVVASRRSPLSVCRDFMPVEPHVVFGNAQWWVIHFN